MRCTLYNNITTFETWGFFGVCFTMHLIVQGQHKCGRREVTTFCMSTVLPDETLEPLDLLVCPMILVLSVGGEIGVSKHVLNKW